MVFAKVFKTFQNGTCEITYPDNQMELGQQLNDIQSQIFEGVVKEAFVEPVDAQSQPIAEMFNNMASDLEKLKQTQLVLKNG